MGAFYLEDLARGIDMILEIACKTRFTKVMLAVDVHYLFNSHIFIAYAAIESFCRAFETV